jgi:hypothetical protein
MLSLPRVVATVELDDSGTLRAADEGGEEGRGVVSATRFFGSNGSVCAASCGGRGERGSMARFSCIECTTFSRSMGVMCFPRASRAWLLAESWRRRSGRDELDRSVAVRAPSKLESSEPTLVESSGTSAAAAAAAASLLMDSWRSNDHRGGNWLSGAQQNVSLPQSLQAIFS